MRGERGTNRARIKNRKGESGVAYIFCSLQQRGAKEGVAMTNAV